MTIQELYAERYHELESKRLMMRQLTIDDAEAMFSYTSRPENFTFLKRSAHKSINETQEFLKKVETSYCSQTDFIWGICEKDANNLIGTCRLFDLHLDDLRGEVSYMIHPDWWGKGIATEAISTLIQYAFDELGFLRIQGRFVAANLGSERVMQKCGMQYEGTHRKYACVHGVWNDFKVYSIIRS